MEQNSASSVMIVIRGSDPKESKIKGFDFHLKKDGTSQLSASGFLFEHHHHYYIITSASIILPFYNSQTNKLLHFTQLEVFGNDFKITKEQLQPIGCIQNDLITKYLNEFLSSSLVDSNLDWKKTTSLFLFQMNHQHYCKSIDPIQSIQLGDDLYCIGSPYGLLSPHIFQNSITRGILCNRFVTNQQTLFYITDTRILPGNEGSAVFCNKTHKVIGFVLPIFASHLYFIFPIHLVISEIDSCTRQLSTTYHDILKYAMLLNIENSWASGIYISNGIIITNAHFIKPFYSNELQIFVRSNRDLLQGDAGKFYLAKCVHLIQEGSLDLAVLQLVNTPSHLQEATLPVDYSCCKGQTVYAIGFPIWSSHSIPIAATMTKGTLSNIVYSLQQPALLQTSALIHNGNSGGLLINDKGQCIGMMVSNTRLQNKNQIVPNLNFAISIHMLQPIFTGNYSELTILSKQLMNVWKFEPLMPSKM